MTSVTYGNAIFGMHDLKVKNLAGTTTEDCGAASLLELTPVLKGGTLEGDDRDVADIRFATRAEGSIRFGLFSSAALEIMTGITLDTDGTSPNEVVEWSLPGGHRMPYFQVVGQGLDDGGGDMHLVASRVKITSFNSSLKFEDGQWRISELTVIALPNTTTNEIVDVLQHETAVTIT